jgi:hypothetical protein
MAASSGPHCGSGTGASATAPERAKDVRAEVERCGARRAVAGGREAPCVGALSIPHIRAQTPSVRCSSTSESAAQCTESHARISAGGIRFLHDLGDRAISRDHRQRIEITSKESRSGVRDMGLDSFSGTEDFSRKLSNPISLTPDLDFLHVISILCLARSTLDLEIAYNFTTSFFGEGGRVKNVSSFVGAMLELVISISWMRSRFLIWPAPWSGPDLEIPPDLGPSPTGAECLNRTRV